MIKYVQAVSPRSAEGLVAQVYVQIKRDFGDIVEPLMLHSRLPELLAGCWSVTRESLVVGGVPREIKEAVAATISKINRCPYCVDAHTMMLHATASHEAAVAIGQSREDQIQDAIVELLVSGAITSKGCEGESTEH